jgi:transposase
LQADGYAGFNKLYEAGGIVEAACWAHYPDSGVIQS